ncbi:unnamed protein product [Calicophoron daubneyi]|uniref:Laminin subunit beta-1 n=1 Tax=Calicophoron daubneyi TaxID=300641 RepID=A0AAV2TMV8_CALDB
MFKLACYGNVAFVVIILIHTKLVDGEEYSCENTICNPRAGDLLIGRESSLWASSTCGLNGIEAYCVVTTSGKSFCKECISSQPYNSITNPESHRIENVVSRVPSNPGRWWQSQNGLHNVSIVLNLDTQFQFISTILRFKTYRPAAMYLERSYDFGRSWRKYAYFSNNCKRDFPAVPEAPRRLLTDVTCTGVYSQLTPSEGGVVAYMAAPSEMHASWPQYSKERMNLTAITNLRAVFTRLNTLGDMHVDDSLLTRRKYYYALYEWNVWGRCTCFGHAVRCKPKSNLEPIKPEKVYGVCECTHNTAGENCETCADFYWNKPWRPATRDAANACEKCSCNNHATACFFNPILYINSGNVSGGNCHECMHNTEGVNCEFCRPNFYRHPDYPIDHPSTCQPCNCHTAGTLHEGFCQQYTIPEQNSVAGRCLCKKNVGGDKCDRCKVGHWNFQADNPEGCEPCSCNMIGTLDNGGCDPYTGTCTCKRFVGGSNCDACLEGYFNLTMAPLGCQECACSQMGAKNPHCNRISGQCECKVGFTGRDCSQVEDGYYVRPPQEIIDRRGEKEITMDGPKGEGRFVIVLDVDPKQFGEGDKWTIIVKPYQHGAKRCSNPAQTVNVYKDTSKIIISDVCLEAGLPIVLRIMPESQPTERYTEILITDIFLVPTDDSELARHCEQYREMATEIISGRRLDRTGLPTECEVYFRLPRVSWRETGSSAEPCMCNTTGSQSEVCNKLTGECPCKPGVVGRKCDQCAPYHYDFSALGCTDCACDPEGSLSLQCDASTSQCHCRPGIVGKHCDLCKPGSWQFPVCRPCECNRFSEICNQTTGACLDCRENTGGEYCERCAEGFYGDPIRGNPCKPCACPGGGVNHARECYMGSLEEQVCICHAGYMGPRCSQCAPNYFGHPTEPNGQCQPCQCSGNIDMSKPGSCDSVTGKCLDCLYNTEGDHCDVCQRGFWGDATRQMCQACKCCAEGVVGGNQTVCDRVNGQCPCLPNVTGSKCCECERGYFNLTSGAGCQPCECDPTGSLDDSCDAITGNCRCKRIRSGRKCDQCPEKFYGNPHQSNGCKPCDCDLTGSISEVCEPSTGQCRCRPGVAGRRCNRCDRGTEGVLPNCKPCGECWTNWDKTIDKIIAELNHLQNQTGLQLPAELEVLYKGLVTLLELIENMPWMNIEDSKLRELEAILSRTETIVEPLIDESSPDRLELLNSQLISELGEEEARNGRLATVKTKLDDVKNRLEKLFMDAGQSERRYPAGAHASVQKAKEIAEKVRGIQNMTESQQNTLKMTAKQAEADLMAIRSRAESVDSDWAQLDRRIGEFKGQILHTNRLLCGDNSAPPPEDADPKVCPSTCGGAACDPVSSSIGTKSSPLSRWHRSTLDLPDPTPSGDVQLDYWTGLLGGCGINYGCNASVGGRLRFLMEQNLELQINLANAVQRLYGAESLILKVHTDRREAENIIANGTAEAIRLRGLLNNSYTILDGLISDARNYANIYGNLTKERFDELLHAVQTAKLNVSVEDARKLVRSLDQLADQLGTRVTEILRETEADRTASANLLKRAETARDNAKDFAVQVQQLREAEALYDDLKEKSIVSFVDDEMMFSKTSQLVSEIGNLNLEIADFAKSSSKQADLAKTAVGSADKLRANAETAREMTLSTLRELENFNISFIQLDEKMNELEKLMSKIDKGTTGGIDEEEPGEKLADPTQLMNEVKNFTAKLEKDTEEIKSITANLKRLEEESTFLMTEMNAQVEKFQKLSDHLSKETKSHRTCK